MRAMSTTRAPIEPSRTRAPQPPSSQWSDDRPPPGFSSARPTPAAPRIWLPPMADFGFGFFARFGLGDFCVRLAV